MRTTRGAIGALLSALAATLVVVGPVAAAGPGELDSSFSGDGYRFVDLGGVADPYEILAEPDGGFTVAGERRKSYYTNDERPRAFFTRFRANGSLDAGFGTGGSVVVDAFSGNVSDTPHGWGRTIDGKYVVAGDLPNGRGYYLIRLNSDGRRDQSFGPGGMRTFATAQKWWVTHLVPLSDGRFVLLGHPGDGIALRAHLADGSLDQSFGDGGEMRDRGHAGSEILVDGDRLIVAGLSRNRFVLRAFGLDGRRVLPFGNRGRAAGPDLRPDGDYLNYGGAAELTGGGFAVVGRPIFSSNEPVYLVRFTETGQLDMSFGGGDGWRTLDVPMSRNVAELFPYELVALPGNRVAMGGYWADPPYDDDGRHPSRAFVAAFNADGSRWRAFGNEGIFASNFGLPRETWLLGAMALVDGKLVIAPTVERYFSEEVEFVAARLTL